VAPTVSTCLLGSVEPRCASGRSAARPAGNMTKHRAFNGDRFLDKFQGAESILRSYVGIWGSGLDIEIESLDVASFKDFILTGDGALKDQFMEGLYRKRTAKYRVAGSAEM